MEQLIPNVMPRKVSKKVVGSAPINGQKDLRGEKKKKLKYSEVWFEFLMKSKWLHDLEI